MDVLIPNMLPTNIGRIDQSTYGMAEFKERKLVDLVTYHKCHWSIDEERFLKGVQCRAKFSFKISPLAAAGARTDTEMCFQIFITVRDGAGPIE
jgi:hypothetical protein